MSSWVFVGDSVTAAGRVRSRPADLGRGWVADVAGRLRRVAPGARVVNLGVSGDRVADVRDRVVADMAGAGVLVPGVVVTLAVGINDVRRAHLDGERFDVGGFATTYGSVLSRVVSAVPRGQVRLVLVEPVLAPADASQAGWSDDLDDVCDHVGSLAAAHQAHVVRVRRSFAEAARADQVTVDGFHPTPAGHLLLADAWWQAVSAVPGLLPDLWPDRASSMLPDEPSGAPVVGRARWWDRLRTGLRGG